MVYFFKNWFSVHLGSQNEGSARHIFEVESLASSMSLSSTLFILLYFNVEKIYLLLNNFKIIYLFNKLILLYYYIIIII